MEMEVQLIRSQQCSCTKTSIAWVPWFTWHHGRYSWPPGLPVNSMSDEVKILEFAMYYKFQETTNLGEDSVFRETHIAGHEVHRFTDGFINHMITWYHVTWSSRSTTT